MDDLSTLEPADLSLHPCECLPPGWGEEEESPFGPSMSDKVLIVHGSFSCSQDGLLSVLQLDVREPPFQLCEAACRLNTSCAFFWAGAGMSGPSQCKLYSRCNLLVREMGSEGELYGWAPRTSLCKKSDPEACWTSTVRRSMLSATALSPQRTAGSESPEPLFVAGAFNNRTEAEAGCTAAGRWLCSSFDLRVARARPVDNAKTAFLQDVCGTQDADGFHQTDCGSQMGAFCCAHCGLRVQIEPEEPRCPSHHPWAYRPKMNFDSCCASEHGAESGLYNSGLYEGRSDSCLGFHYTECPGSGCADYRRTLTLSSGSYATLAEIGGHVLSLELLGGPLCSATLYQGLALKIQGSLCSLK